MSRYEAAVTGPVAQFLRGRGIDKAQALTSRLGVVADPLPGHTRYTGRLAIPYLGPSGQPLTIRFRCLEDHDHRAFNHGKYMSLPEDPVRVYNVGAIFRAGDEIHVAEGELDAVILNKVGLPAIAIPGARLWRNHHRRMLAGFSRVWVWGDPDDAGAEFIAKITKSLRSAKGVTLRDGDVTDTYMAGGAEALYAAIKREVPA